MHNYESLIKELPTTDYGINKSISGNMDWTAIGVAIRSETERAPMEQREWWWCALEGDEYYIGEKKLMDSCRR